MDGRKCGGDEFSFWGGGEAFNDYEKYEVLVGQCPNLHFEFACFASQNTGREKHGVHKNPGEDYQGYAQSLFSALDRILSTRRGGKETGNGKIMLDLRESMRRELDRLIKAEKAESRQSDSSISPRRTETDAEIRSKARSPSAATIAEKMTLNATSTKWFDR